MRFILFFYQNDIYKFLFFTFQTTPIFLLYLTYHIIPIQMQPKRLYNVLIVILSYFLPIDYMSAQISSQDSLLRLIKPNNSDAQNGRIYYELAKKYYSSDTKNALKWAQEGANYYRNINSYDTMNRCLNIEAVCLLILDRPDESLKLHYQILKKREQLKDTLGMAESLLNIGNIFYKGLDKEQAIDYYLKSGVYALKKKNIKLLSNVYNNLAGYYTDEYSISKKTSDRTKAIKYVTKAIQYKEKLQIDKAIEQSYSILSKLFHESGNLEAAITYNNKAENIALKNKNDEIVGSSKIFGAQLAIENKEYNVAEKKIDELYKYMTSNKALHILEIFENDIINIRKIIKNNRLNATIDSNIITSNKYESNIDTLLLLSRQKIREELKVKYDTEKKELDNANLLLKNKIERDKAETNKLISIISLVFTFILGILLIILFKKNRSIKSSKTSLQDQAKQLHHQNTLLKDSEAFKAKLFSIISHDLKSPITSLKSIVELSSDTTLSPEQSAYLMQEMKKELDITSNLLDDLLFWAKTQIKSDSLTCSWVNLNSIIEKCINTLRPNLNLKQLKINNLIPHTYYIWVDESRAEFIIRNVLHNAIKYSEFNQKIELGAKENDEFLDFYIKDYGIGMSEEQLQKIFSHNYSRKSTKGTYQEQGSGIGLLLCSDFAETLGWSIVAESSVDVGTTFHIKLKSKDSKKIESSIEIDSDSTPINS